MHNVTKHQHTVPQFYLRQFASNDEKIWAFDKQTGRSFHTSIRNVAGERFFYDSKTLEEVTGDKQALEKFLSQLEGYYHNRIGRLLERLRANEYRRLHPETRMTIANFAAVQFLRTKERRTAHRQTVEHMAKILSKFEGAEQLLRDADEALSAGALQEFHVARLIDLPLIKEFTEILASHIWVFGRRHPSHSFYTSDNPIARHGTVARPFRGNRGIGSRGVEIHIPLSHDYALTLYERTHFKSLENQDGRVLDLFDPEHMVYARQWQVSDSSRYVFCRDDDFGLAREMCAADPQLTDPDRKRVTSNHDVSDEAADSIDPQTK